MKTLRLLEEEHRALERACDALQGIDRATLIMEAALHMATRLGIEYTTTEPAPFKGPWPFTPSRGEEATGTRLTITLSLTTLELVGRAAKHVGVSEPLFLIGSVFAYIGRLQKKFEGTHSASPELASVIRGKLRAITLPTQYRYRERRTP
jgi:uncharacterized protein (DUF1778 family)